MDDRTTLAAFGIGVIAAIIVAWIVAALLQRRKNARTMENRFRSRGRSD